ncbi:MAG: BlaI/MecI/CopY family transcriptional regulator [Bacillota bacterium]|nr:BlaI/MecI/CopY family transcriptional regulator [Bacillota bacterium]
MGEYKLADAEAKFADIIWENEPISSPELVKLCEREMNWKKSTTYTVLKKLCEKGIFKNENALVTARLGREEFYGMQSRRYVEDVFDGSLPRFLTAFCGGRKLSRLEVEEMKKFIDENT